MMHNLPADVQAALDAYLAARTNDAVWECYVDSLGPSVALDVAALLADRCHSDADAAEELVFWYDPASWEDDEDGPPGVPAMSATLDGYINNASTDCTVTFTIEYGPGAGACR